MKLLDIITAVEWGYHACEKGWSLEKTLDECMKLCRPNAKVTKLENTEDPNASMSKLPKQRK